MDRSYHVHIHVIRIMILLLLLSSFLSCSKQEETQETYMLKIDEMPVDEAEVMVYAYQVYEEFINIGGENVWEFEDFSGGKSALDVAAEAVLKNIVRIKTIQKKADEFRIQLSEEQVRISRTQGSKYYLQLPEAFRQEHGITEEIVHKVFIEFARARSVYNDLTSDLNPDEESVEQVMLENSEYRKLVETAPKDFLTQMTVWQIFVADDAQGTALDNIEHIYQQIIEGVDFEELAITYNQSDVMEQTYSKALLPEAFAFELAQLSEGEVSTILDDKDGYYLFKMMNIEEPSPAQLLDFNENFIEYEQKIRTETIEQLKSEHFDVVYDEWRRNTIVDVDREQWEKVDFDFE
ncbi:hypothetical protein QBE53_12830 [Vallitaleaceae bacterium 9-2]